MYTQLKRKNSKFAQIDASLASIILFFANVLATHTKIEIIIYDIAFSVVEAKHSTMDRFIQFYNNPIDSDIKIKVGDDIIHCHKIILRGGSGMLQVGLSSTMREISAGVFMFPEHKIPIVERTIKWIYGLGFKITDISADEYCDLIAFSHYLQVDDLFIFLTSNAPPARVKLSQLIDMVYVYEHDKLLNDAQHNQHPRNAHGKLLRNFVHLCMTLSPDEIARSFKDIVPIVYSRFRDHLQESGMRDCKILEIDCIYIHVVKYEVVDALKIFNKMTDTIRYDTFTVAELERSLEFPGIKNSCSMRNILRCMINMQKKANSICLTCESIIS